MSPMPERYHYTRRISVLNQRGKTMNPIDKETEESILIGLTLKKLETVTDEVRNMIRILPEEEKTIRMRQFNSILITNVKAEGTGEVYEYLKYKLDGLTQLRGEIEASR